MKVDIGRGDKKHKIKIYNSIILSAALGLYENSGTASLTLMKI
jgi:hypothetical protein